MEESTVIQEKKGEMTDMVMKEPEKNLAKMSTWSLKKELKRQTESLATMSVESDKYKTTLEMIQKIQVILSIRANTRTNVLKVIGGLGIGALGLGLAYGLGDKSPDFMPNRATKQAADSFAGKLFKF